jgi:hypothetical protein
MSIPVLSDIELIGAERTISSLSTLNLVGSDETSQISIKTNEYTIRTGTTKTTEHRSKIELNCRGIELHHNKIVGTTKYDNKIILNDDGIKINSINGINIGNINNSPYICITGTDAESHSIDIPLLQTLYAGQGQVAYYLKLGSNESRTIFPIINDSIINNCPTDEVIVNKN